MSSDCSFGSEYVNGSCSQCPSKTYQNISSSICIDCPPGKYSSESGVTRCIDCPQNTYNAYKKQGSCGSCPVQTFSSPASTDISNCSSNVYNYQLIDLGDIIADSGKIYFLVKSASPMDHYAAQQKCFQIFGPGQDSSHLSDYVSFPAEFDTGYPANLHQLIKRQNLTDAYVGAY
jgi:hypothetical protein